MVAINTSKVHINNMYIQCTFVHFAILLIHQIVGVVSLPVTSPFAVEALSLRLRTRLGLLHLSSNLLAVLLEVPLLPFALLLKLVFHTHARVERYETFDSTLPTRWRRIAQLVSMCSECLSTTIT